LSLESSEWLLRELLPPWCSVEPYRVTSSSFWSLERNLFSAFRFTLQSLSRLSVLWRVILLGIGVLYAINLSDGDLVFSSAASQGVTRLDIPDLERIANRWPAIHEHRHGPCLTAFILRDEIDPSEGIQLCRETLKRDPYSFDAISWMVGFAMKANDRAALKEAIGMATALKASQRR